MAARINGLSGGAQAVSIALGISVDEPSKGENDVNTVSTLIALFAAREYTTTIARMLRHRR